MCMNLGPKISGNLLVQSSCKFNFEWKNGLTQRKQSMRSDFRNIDVLFLVEQKQLLWYLTLDSVDRF